MKSDLWAGERAPEPIIFVCDMHTHMEPLAMSRHQTYWENVCVWVRCVLVFGGGGLRLSPKSIFHLRGGGQVALEGKVRRHLIRSCLFTRPGRCAVSAWPSCKYGGLIKPTARHKQAHKRGWWKWGEEWALMVIGIELHWQGWGFKVWIPRQACCLRWKQAVESTCRLRSYYNAVC